MNELRASLGVLRQLEEPEAGLSGLPRLVSRAERAGLRVSHTVVGEPYALAAEADRAAYRIVQEALTNVLRHAGTAAAVTVTVEYDHAKVVLRVENDGEPGTPGPGMGLIGMRERAVAVGGSVTAGPGESGGFAVRAELPTGPVPA
ncbi:sensor histidine kinase [Nonomuraea antimicrobica]